jgi:hypothetical protein
VYKMLHVSSINGRRQVRINEKEGSQIPWIVVCTKEITLLQLYLLQLHYCTKINPTHINYMIYKIFVCYDSMYVISLKLCGARGGAFFKALRYKPENREFDSRRCHWDFSFS